MTGYTTGLLLTMATSHLLLNMGSRPKTEEYSEESDMVPLTPYLHEAPFIKMLRYHHSRPSVPQLPEDSFVYPLDSRSRSSSRASTAHSDGTTVHVQETYIRKRAWWLLGAGFGSPAVETRVTIDRYGDIEQSGNGSMGVKVSRLGRYDNWL